MKIAVVADVHVGNHRRFGGHAVAGVNQRARGILNVLSTAVDRSLANGCDRFIVAGDLFDDDRPTPQLLNAVAEVFSADGKAARKRIRDWRAMTLLGNHEMTSTELEDHALAPFQWMDGTMVVGKPWSERDVVYVPFEPRPAADVIEDALARVNDVTQVRPPAPHRAIVVHAGLSTSGTPPFLRDAQDQLPVERLAELMRKHRIRAAFAGNWHGRAIWREPSWDDVPLIIMQVGALVPTGFDNPGLDGLYGTVAYYDTDSATCTWEELPGPRFVTARSADDLRALAAARRLSSLQHPDVYARVVGVDPSAIADLQTEFRELIVEPDEVDATVAARTAAQVARSAETLSEAVDAYVREVALPEGVDRAAVRARVARYLGEAR